MSIAEKLNTIYTAKNDIKAAINDKGGNVGDDITVYAEAISQLEGGGSDEPRSTWLVWFIDYDGTELSYQEVEDGGTIVYPDAPDHTDDGLVFTGWNESKTIANSTNFYDDNMYRMIVIGAIYDTFDTASRFWINPTYANLSFGLRIQPTVATGCVIDWGDGTTTTSDSQPAKVYTHTYTADKISSETIIVTITCTSGTYAIVGSSTSTPGYSGIKPVKIQIGSKCKSISTYAFYNCYSLQSVSIPNSVTSISSSAFQYCYSLQSINIPNSVTSIGNTVFSGCFSLQSVSIPNSVTSISSSAFQNNHSLRSISSIFIKLFVYTIIIYGINNKCIYNENKTIETNSANLNYFIINVNIPSSVTSIGNNAFYYCYSLQSINIPNSVTSIGSTAFNGCYSLQSITIPNSVTSIGSGAFQYCYSLQSITIPNSVTSIGSTAFYYCYSLQSVSIPNSVTSIGNSVFQYCYSLQSITIPNSVTSIGSGAFQNNYSLQKIDFGNTRTTIPTLSNVNALQGTNNCPIIVPDALYDEWKTKTNWSSTTNNIVNRIIKYSDYYK